MPEPNVIVQSSRFVSRLFRQSLPSWAIYHTRTHTAEVVAACREIGEASGVDQHSLEILLLSAWFHDTGYTSTARGHEERSVEIAAQFLNDLGYPTRAIARISHSILATKMPQRPTTLLERILCDADLYSLSTRGFFRQNERLKLEIEQREGSYIEDLVWLRRTHRFVLSHRYHTPYAREVLAKGRLANLLKLESMLDGR